MEYAKAADNQARLLMARYLGIDIHVHTLLWAYLFGIDPTRRQVRRWPRFLSRKTDFIRTAEGLIGAQFQALASPPFFGEQFAYRMVNGQIGCLDRMAESRPDMLVKSLSAEDIERAYADNRIACLLGVEGTHGLGGKLDNVAKLAKRGVRYLSLAHFSRNRACSPSVGLGADPNRGLTGFGRELIAACEDAGVIVDLAHLNRRGFMEAISLSRKPMIVTHTGVRGVFNHPRNLDDEQILAIGEIGGLIGIMFVAWVMGGLSPRLPIDHLIRIINLIGEDRVAIGSDLDSPVTMIPEYSDPFFILKFVQTLLGLGWSETVVTKLIRLNVLRLLRDVPPVYVG